MNFNENNSLNNANTCLFAKCGFIDNTTFRISLQNGIPDVAGNIFYSGWKRMSVIRWISVEESTEKLLLTTPQRARGG
jgi:hypothetical protein